MDTALAVQKVFKALENSDAKRAVLYIAPKLVVSLCRRFKKKSRDSRADFVLKVGAPNYLERNFVRACQKAGEPFPVKKVQLQAWPAKRSK